MLGFFVDQFFKQICDIELSLVVHELNLKIVRNDFFLVLLLLVGIFAVEIH